MADASIGMEMNTYTIGSGMSGENLLEKDYAVMNLDPNGRKAHLDARVGAGFLLSKRATPFLTS